MGEYIAFTDGHPAERPLRGRRGAAAGADGDHRAGPERQGVHDRRSVRRNQGAARRVLPDRGPRSERRDPGGRRRFRRRAWAASRSGRSWSSASRSGALHCRTPATRAGAAGHRGRGLPRRLAPRARHPHPPPRRLRPRRGGAARRVHGGGRAVAARRRSRQSAGLARLHRALQGDRRHPPARAVRRVAARACRAARRPRRRAVARATRTTSRTIGCG